MACIQKAYYFPIVVIVILRAKHAMGPLIQIAPHVIQMIL